MGKSAGLLIYSIITKANGVTHFTELHRILHKNILNFPFSEITSVLRYLIKNTAVALVLPSPKAEIT